METNNTSKTLHIVLWIVQVLLAAMLLWAGYMKVSQPIEELAQELPWAKDIPLLLVRFIGISELAGALGLILPSLLRIQSELTVWAGIGIMLIMIFAVVFHISRAEYNYITVNVIMLAAGGFVAWGRNSQAVIEDRF